MSPSTWNEVDTGRALQIWADYQCGHDLADRAGQTAGIDPISGRVWFGESAADIWRQRQAQGIDAPFYCVGVGYEYYLRKGSHR